MNLALALAADKCMSHLTWPDAMAIVGGALALAFIFWALVKY